MKRATYILLCSAMLAGCRNQTADMNLLAPYGSTTVPVPATSSHAGVKQYYNQQQPTSTPTVTTPTLRSNSLKNPAQANNSLLQTNTAVSWEPVGTGVKSTTANPVQNVSYSEPVDDHPTAESSPSNATDDKTPSLRLNGMPVNDATGLQQPTEPAPFQPNGAVREISQLPPTAAQPMTSGIVTATAKASDNLKRFVNSLPEPNSIPASGNAPQWRAPNGSTPSISNGP